MINRKLKPEAILDKEDEDKKAKSAKVSLQPRDVSQQGETTSEDAGSEKVKKGMKKLDSTFQPGAFDVICGSAPVTKNHLGNVNFKRKVEEAADSYGNARSKVDKSTIVSSIVEWIRIQSPNGGFVKQLDNGDWYKVDNTAAREKVSQALRDSSRALNDDGSDTDQKGMTKLDESFIPGPFDVIIARGAKAQNHIGNINLKRKIHEESDSYTQAKSKLDKSTIVSSIIEWVRIMSPNGGFVKQLDDGAWYEVGTTMAREKIGQQFRDRNHRHYKSSMKSKRQRWKKEQRPQKQQQAMLPQGGSGANDDANIHGLTQTHEETIEKGAQSIERSWTQLGGSSANDAQTLESFTQHNLNLLETLKADTMLAEGNFDPLPL